MVENPAVRGHSVEPGPILDSAIERGAPAHPRGMEENGHRARRLNGRGEQASREHARLTVQHVVDRYREGRPASLEGLDRQKTREPAAKEITAQEPQARAGIPEIL